MACAGTVKWFSFKNGYGFIANKEGGEDLFVHATKVKGNPLKEGDEVTFELGTDEKTGKQCAESVEGGSGYPSKGKGKGRSQRRAREGDWKCTNCGAHCFASKDECYKCNTKKADNAEAWTGA